MAQAGGTNPAALPTALASVEAWVGQATELRLKGSRWYTNNPGSWFICG